MGLKRYKMSKREAKLVIHVARHFPRGFTEEDLAASLGWPVEEVRAALETCAVFGLIAPPRGSKPLEEVVVQSGSPVGIDDLLTPEEQAEARGPAGTTATGGKGDDRS